MNTTQKEPLTRELRKQQTERFDKAVGTLEALVGLGRVEDAIWVLRWVLTGKHGPGGLT